MTFKFNAIVDMFGAAITGIVAEAFIFGLLTLQVFTYFSKYPRDHVWQKMLVGFVWGLECFQLIVVTHMIYDYMINILPTDRELMDTRLWAWPTYLGLSSVAAFCAQMFFARRVFALCQHPILRYVLVVAITGISLIQIGFGIAFMSLGFKLPTFKSWVAFTWGIDLWLGAACMSDVTIAASMCILLHSSRTGAKQTDRLINRLMAYSIQTGLLTAIAEIVSMATFSSMGWNFAHVFLSYPLGGLFCVSFLANLLARKEQSVMCIADSGVIEFSQRSGFGGPSTTTSPTTYAFDKPTEILPVYGIHKHIETIRDVC